MNNRKIAVIISVFALLITVGAIALSVAGHIPFLGKALSLIVAVLIMIFVIVFFAVIVKGKNSK